MQIVILVSVADLNDTITCEIRYITCEISTNQHYNHFLGLILKSILTGSTALMLQQPTYNAVIGRSIEMSVHAAGDPILMASEIRWTNPENQLLTNPPSDARLTLSNTNRLLTIRNVNNADTGRYTVDITRIIGSTTFRFAIEHIQLDVHGKIVHQDTYCIQDTSFVLMSIIEIGRTPL